MAAEKITPNLRLEEYGTSATTLDTSVREWRLSMNGVQNSNTEKIDGAFGNALNNLTTNSKTIVPAINELNQNKIPKSDIVDNLTTSEKGKVLDASQGKALNDIVYELYHLKGYGKSPNTNDANTILENGKYGRVMVNTPTGDMWNVEVIKHTTGFLTQIAVRFATNEGLKAEPLMYIRNMSQSNWSEWKKIALSNDYNITSYTSYTQLGLSSKWATVEECVQSMPNGSMGLYDMQSNFSNFNIFPSSSGVLTVNKQDQNRCYLTYNSSVIDVETSLLWTSWYREAETIKYYWNRVNIGRGDNLTITDFNLMLKPIMGTCIVNLATVKNAPFGASGNQRVRLEVTVDEPTKKVITQRVIYQDGAYNKKEFIRCTPDGGNSWSYWSGAIDYIVLVSYLNGYADDTGGGGSSIIKDGNTGVVTYIGAIKKTTGAFAKDEIMATLPTGLRPPKHVRVMASVYPYGVQGVPVIITSTGNVQIREVVPNMQSCFFCVTYVSLNS